MMISYTNVCLLWRKRFFRNTGKRRSSRTNFFCGFERKMRQLIKRMLQKERYGFPVTTVRRVAAVIVVAAGVMAASLSVEAVRDKVYEFVRTIYETFTETMYSVPEGTTGEFRPLYPAYIPEGCLPFTV